MLTFRSRLAAAAALLLLLSAVACGDSGGTGPEQEAPLITVGGVQDGGTYNGAVTIDIGVNRGSYEALLNGQPFSTGSSVSLPGAYTLVVNARNGLATATRQVSFSIAAPTGGTLIIRMFDLGRDTAAGGSGDAILVTDSSAAGLVHAIIDAGPDFVAGLPYVANRLASLGVDTLAFMLLTHAHGDHYLGMQSILNSVKVRTFYHNGQVRNLASYTSLLSLAGSRADSVIILRDTLGLGFGRSAVQARFTLIHGLPTWLNSHTNDGTQLNEGSLGASLRRGAFSMFFTGDGEYQANARWRTQFANYTRDLTVLKVGHHGANNAIFDAGTTGPSSWLDHTSPSVSIISASGTHHPRLRALARLMQQPGNRTYCTSVHGDIVIRVWADASYQVYPQRAADSDCVPGSSADT